jgi:hypothetical protein
MYHRTKGGAPPRLWLSKRLTRRNTSGAVLLVLIVVCIVVLPVDQWLADFMAWGVSHKVYSALIINGVYAVFPMLFLPTGQVRPVLARLGTFVINRNPAVLSR